MKASLIGAGVIAAAIAAATGAQAHAHLVSASPSAGQMVVAPRVLQLRFSERLEPRFSGFTVARVGGPGVPAQVVVSPDGKTLVGRVAAPLPAGTYRVSWRAVAADAHRMQGDYTFMVH